jgi:exodeoxyribonuclease VII small subunit
LISRKEKKMAEVSDATEVTFEEGYEELKQLVADVDDEEITVHEMCEKFARGKGLEQALRAYLDEQQGKLKEIEEGRNVPEFRVVAPSRKSRPDEDSDVPADTSDFATSDTAGVGANDDIPF